MERPTKLGASKSDATIDGNAQVSDIRSVPNEEKIDYKKCNIGIKQKISSLKDIRINGPKNNITVVRSNKLVHALDLPIIINLNPRSVYNKVDEFHTLVQEEEADVIFMSESWGRDNLTLDKIIKGGATLQLS